MASAETVKMTDLLKQRVIFLIDRGIDHFVSARTHKSLNEAKSDALHYRLWREQQGVTT